MAPAEVLPCVTRQRTKGPSGRRLPTSNIVYPSHPTDNEKENEAEVAASAPHQRLETARKCHVEPEVAECFDDAWFLSPTPSLAAGQVVAPQAPPAPPKHTKPKLVLRKKFIPDMKAEVGVRPRVPVPPKLIKPSLVSRIWGHGEAEVFSEVDRGGPDVAPEVAPEVHQDMIVDPFQRFSSFFAAHFDDDQEVRPEVWPEVGPEVRSGPSPDPFASLANRFSSNFVTTRFVSDPEVIPEVKSEVSPIPAPRKRLRFKPITHISEKDAIEMIPEVKLEVNSKSHPVTPFVPPPRRFNSHFEAQFDDQPEVSPEVEPEMFPPPPPRRFLSQWMTSGSEAGLESLLDAYPEVLPEPHRRLGRSKPLFDFGEFPEVDLDTFPEPEARPEARPEVVVSGRPPLPKHPKPKLILSVVPESSEEVVDAQSEVDCQPLDWEVVAIPEPPPMPPIPPKYVFRLRSKMEFKICLIS